MEVWKYILWNYTLQRIWWKKSIGIRYLFYTKNSGLDIRIAKSDSHNNYYYGIRIKAKIIIDGVEHEIGDGGLLNWTQNLLANKKERMLTMGIGIQLLHLFKKQKCWNLKSYTKAK